MLVIGDKSYTKAEIDLLSIPELNKLMCEVQEAIHKAAAEKNYLTTLPNNRKNIKTLKKVKSVSNDLMTLQDSVNYISAVRKAKRDTQMTEIQWLRKFYDLCSVSLRKSQMSKLECETTAQVGYGRP